MSDATRTAVGKIRELSGDVEDCLSGGMPHDTLTYRGSLLHELLEASLVLQRAYLAEHPADENEAAELGTLYIDGCTRIELRSTGIKTVSIAMQTLGWDWDWVCLRTWEYPAAPTRRDVRRLLEAMGIEVKS